MIRGAPLIAQLTAVVIWSTTFVVSSSLLDRASPAVLTVLRFAIAAIVLLPLALRRSGLLAVLRAPVTAALGLTGVAGYYGLQNLGLLTATPGTAAVLQAVLPVGAAALGVAVLHERLSVASVVGLALATAGAALAGSAGAARVDVGAVLIVAGVLCYAAYTVLLRRLGSIPASRASTSQRVGTADPVVLAAATALWGLAFLMPWLLAEGVAGNARLPSGALAITATLYLGIVASGATLLLWTYGARYTAASVSGILTAAIPALGYAIALLSGETPSWTKTFGGLLAVAGVLIATIAVQPPSRARAPLARSGEVNTNTTRLPGAPTSGQGRSGGRREP